MKRIIYSCVVQDKPVLKAQLFVWISVFLNHHKVDPRSLYVHVVGEMEDKFLGWLKAADVNIIRTVSSGFDNVYCNKLLQLETFSDIEFDYICFMDCDTVILDLSIPNQESFDVYAKVVDFPNPPLGVINNVFKEAGITAKEIPTSFIKDGEQITLHGNCNGGVYFISKRIFDELSRTWQYYLDWCLENIALFSEYAKHADQVSFALAINNLNCSINYLDLGWNFPLHISSAFEKKVDLKVIHYHNLLDAQLNIKYQNVSWIDSEIELINKAINVQIRSEFNNSLFWDLRYSLYPELGSGIGSRGEILENKRNLLRELTNCYQSVSVLDVGCGDLELSNQIPFHNYFGVDVSKVAIDISNQKRPDWNFYHGNVYDDGVPEADVVICFDVLIHQSDKKEYKRILKSLCNKSRKRLIVGAYADEPSYSSSITHYHGSIIEEIKSSNTFDEISVAATYRDVTVIVATKNETDVHDRDIASLELNRAFEEVDNPRILQNIVDTSRQYFGFYTSHYTRVFEYSWLLENFSKSAGERVLDIGAGVCALPICLDNLGHNVTTIDLHETERNLDNISQWNEWGYLDYSIFSKTISSYNIDFSLFEGDKSKFDSIYSISVIEHMPIQNRRGVLSRASELLRLKGRLLLTVDLVPNTDLLWNLSEGKVVEDHDLHGNIDTLKGELSEYGFKIISEEILREIHTSRTDVLFLIAELVKS